MAEHGEAIEYDLLGLGLDLGDLGTARLSWRRLRNVLRQSPEGSAYAAALSEISWSRTDQLLNLLVYVTRWAHWSGKGKSPEMIPMSPVRRSSRSLSKSSLAAWRNGELPAGLEVTRGD